MRRLFNLRRLLQIFFLQGLLFLCFVKNADANTIFTDDFNSTASAANWIINGPQLFNGDSSQANWQFKNGQYGIQITNRGSQFNETIPNNWDNSVKNYVFSTDIILNNGVDTNLVFRYNDHTHWYGIHGINGSDNLVLQKAGGIWTPPPPIRKFHFMYGKAYRFKVIVFNERVRVYIDGNLIWDVVDNNQPYLEGAPGLQASTGGITSVDVWFDNVNVVSIDSLKSLDVPLLKQTSNPWQSQIYDSANLWNPLNPSINAWGCALTSAAMVFKFHGINKLPSGITLDPGTLNTWLKDEKDGYVGDGLVNWLALSRLSKLATDINNITTFDALEYSRVSSGNIPQLKADIDNNIPGILEEPGHFIVGKGHIDDEIEINDPYYDRTDLASYSGTFLTLGRFIPSQTDLSYILITNTQNIQMALKDSEGNTIASSFQQNPIINPLDSNQTSGSPIQMLYAPKPATGNYTLLLTSTSQNPYQIKTYFYDDEANVQISTASGILSNQETVKLNFDKENASNSTSERVVTVDTLQNDFNQLVNTKKITDVKFIKKFNSGIKALQKSLKKGKRETIMKNLEKLNTQVEILKTNQEAYLLLHQDIVYLKSHL